jgi:hypothetical protein
VEVVPSGTAAMLLPLSPLSPFLFSRPRVDDHSETTRMAQDYGGACWWAASWAKHYELSGVVVFLGSGEILVGSSGTDVVTPAGVAFLPEGPRCTPFPLPSAYRGKL